MEMRHSESPRIDFATLRSRVKGQVIAPTDEGYDAARAVVMGMFDGHPAAIVKVADANDIVTVVGIARETGLELAVRSGGHSGAGHSTTDGGIVIDLRNMKAIDIDVAGRTAWAETGVTAKEFGVATTAHGLVVGFGDAGSVGLGGIVSGGGVGYLTRKFGMTIDALIGAEIVTADGRIVYTDASTEPDLFWAIRGGGGNFGVISRMKFRLEQLAGLYGGMLILPATPETIAGFVAAAKAAPDEVSTIANVFPAPPMPFLPPEVHGKLVIFANLAFAGDAAAGEAALRPFRELAKPHADMMRPIQLPDLYPPEDPNYRPTASSRTMFIDSVDEATAATIIDRLEKSDAAMRVVQLRVLGGAASRVPADATAFGHRASKIMVNIAAFYTGPEDKAVRDRWVAEVAAALRQGDQAVYVNFLGDEGPDRVKAAYPAATWDRLRKIKAKYDPTNLFHRNQNIPPAA
ncbi:MAG: FAD-binding oxidoreductase [Bauldia sp.]